jgi:AcrR family transcriptional regulator
VNAVTRAAAKEATRARLLDVAIDRFAAEGLDVGFDQIAGDAGLTKGALFHHFGSKDGLVQEVYREAIRRHAEQVTAATERGNGRRRLLALIDESARLYTSRTPFYTLLVALHMAAGTTHPTLEPIARRVMARQRDYMIGLVELGIADGSIRAGADAEGIGVTVNSALMGFFVQTLEPPAVQRRWVRRFRTLVEELLS